MRRLTAIVFAAALAFAGCGGDDPPDATGSATATVRLVTHDSFNVSEDVLEAFADDTGITIEIVRSGDAGAALNQAILTKDNPLGDVFFGVDNTFLGRALDEDLFVAYESPRLAAVPDRFILDPEHRVTPIDHGEVCVNYDKAYFQGTGRTPPSSLDDLVDPAYRDLLVVENPATSSPGLAFLLATIARYGEDGWQQWWTDLKANGVVVTSGWEEAYYQEFSGGSGEGERPLVVSYATSPPAEVVFAEEPPEEAPTGVMIDGCFEQIEFAGILRGTEHQAEAREVIDFLLSQEFQSDIPLQMFVFPVVDDVDLPEVFVEHAAEVEDPLTLDPARISEMREAWIERWTATVLG